MIGFGDADEIPARKNLRLLQYCTPRNNASVDIGISFQYGTLDYAFRSDFPARASKHKHVGYTLGDPTYYIIGSLEKDKPVSRARGASENALLGGGMCLSPYRASSYDESWILGICNTKVHFMHRMQLCHHRKLSEY